METSNRKRLIVLKVSHPLGVPHRIHQMIPGFFVQQTLRIAPILDDCVIIIEPVRIDAAQVQLGIREHFPLCHDSIDEFAAGQLPRALQDGRPSATYGFGSERLGLRVTNYFPDALF
eukprot:214777_1